MKAVYPGTFDPITLGHLDIIERAAKFVDELHIVIAVNPNKKTTFDTLERMNMIKRVTSGLKNIVVASTTDLIVRYAKEKKIELVIRGLRNFQDYEHEYSLFQYNTNINSKIETILLFPRSTTNFISSSSIKELVYYNADISKYIPKEIINDVINRLRVIKDF